MLTVRIERKPVGFWLWLCRFAYRRVRGVATKTPPVGIPGMRDPDYPCAGYEPRPRSGGDWGDCLSDGHYQCNDCVHLKRCETCGERVSACECEEVPAC